eukprot:CAMPEP_0184871468 /NCGR_PEP_ID=MMETSP0580-20130426/40736_1 /TAXON_ID=1118495 /ORGANISM="Dactyliosolen fragilissimus" /LENGTH=586 /DNA_ID=CAMNT_0027374131 /DNA_START=37 /DNA_END=1797 /DNA_ORIENTATION=+
MLNENSKSTTIADNGCIRAWASYKPDWDLFSSTPPTLIKNGATTNTTNPTGGRSSKIGEESKTDSACHSYDFQYSHVYQARLMMLRERCISSIPNANIIPRIIELNDEETVTVVGTIVKNSPSRPAVDTSYHSHAPLDKKNEDVREPLRTVCGYDDELFLEDGSGRVELLAAKEAKENGQIGGGEPLDINSLATGVVVAVTGKVRPNTGIMDVQTVHFPTVVSQERDSGPDQPMESEETDDDAYIMLLSGLHCGAVEGENGHISTSLRREMLLDYLSGMDISSLFACQNGEGQLQNNIIPQGSKICRIIVAGGGCAKTTSFTTTSPFGDWSSKKPKSSSSSSTNLTDDSTLPIRELDLFLAQLCAAGIPTDYLPSVHDPTNINWPQKPLHSCLLPHSGTYPNMLATSTNPYKSTIGGNIVLGSDGANIADIRQYLARNSDDNNNHTQEENDDEEKEMDGDSSMPSKSLTTVTMLEALTSTLKFSHIAPTGPDSLPTFPFHGFDPFVIDQAPHLYFCGNCDSYETSIMEHESIGGRASEDTLGATKKSRTRLVCVPSFADAGEVVLVNVKTLDCQVLQFQEICDLRE